MKKKNIENGIFHFLGYIYEEFEIFFWNDHLSEITELKYTSLIKMVNLEENFKWHLEAFASELFICIYIYNPNIENSIIYSPLCRFKDN